MGRDQLPSSLTWVLAVFFVSCWTVIHWLLAEGHSRSSATWASPQDRSQMTACFIRTRKLGRVKERGRGAQAHQKSVFCNLISGELSHHLYHVLFIRSKSQVQAALRRGNHPVMWIAGSAILSGHLGGLLPQTFIKQDWEIFSHCFIKYIFASFYFLSFWDSIFLPIQSLMLFQKLQRFY